MSLRTFGAQLKALVRKELSFISSGGPGSFVLGLSRLQYNYSATVADGLLSSVVMPTTQFMMRAFPEAPLVVRRREADELEIVDNHPLTQLVDRPNAFYPGTLLWMTTILDWVLFGESYWQIRLNRGGQPGELWWLPPWSVSPKWPQDNSVFISHYEYHPDGMTSIRLEIEEVLHFRHGMDPRDPRHGLPPLRAIMQDIWVDWESNNFVGAMLRNMGIPGLIMSPKGDNVLSESDVERVKAYVSSRFTGDHRGEPMALGLPTDIQKLSFSPTELDMSTLRNTAEERVCAALGIPAAVVGFGTGLDSTKVGATMREYVKLAWTNGIVPMQRLLAAELQRILLPYFEADPDGYLTGWNYDEVEAMQESRDDLAQRYHILVTGGILKVSEAREALGYESDPEDEIYLRPNNLTPIDPTDQMPEPEPLPVALPAGTPPANGQATSAQNGNGNRSGEVQARDYLKQGTTEEFINGIIGRQVQRMERPPTSATRLANRLWRDDQKAQPRFQQMLTEVLQRYGSRARLAAKEILFPQKQDLSHLISAGIILERMPVASVQAELAAVYEQMYEIMLGLTVEAVKDAMGLELTNPTAIATQLRNLARERVALLDLSGEARTAVLRTLEEAQAAGLDEDAMLKLLEERIPAGRWGSVETRSRIIARSESRLASNISTAGAARDLGANLLVFDSRLGSFDAPCDERVGWIVTPAQAQALSGVEHASGTLSFGIITAQAATTSQAGAAAT